eukprot:m.15384 g.15384  ORF g.15384 m.15384 type:complete len:398 (+) comp10554_c0_seq1:107-1300(+)
MHTSMFILRDEYLARMSILNSLSMVNMHAHQHLRSERTDGAGGKVNVLSGNDQGLLHVDFTPKEAIKLLEQSAIDSALSCVWIKADAASIFDVTQEMMGSKASEFTGERWDLWRYEKKQLNPATAKFEPMSGQKQFVILDGVLNPNECQMLVDIVSTRWSPVEPRYRQADVYVLNAPILSAHIQKRLDPYIPDVITDEFGQVWDLVGANNGFFRLIRYVVQKVDNYPEHYDLQVNRLDCGVLPGCQDDETKGRRCQVAKTMLTFNMYLNGNESFDGGVFTMLESPSVPLFDVQPKAGRAFLLRQGQTKGYLHTAASIDNGCKNILRMDFVYKKRCGYGARGASKLWTCGQCPEQFGDHDAAAMHEGIHDNPISEGYLQWKRRLNSLHIDPTVQNQKT